MNGEQTKTVESRTEEGRVFSEKAVAAPRVRFSLAIRLYAVASGLTVKEIAQHLEISDSMLSLIMAGKRDPGRGFRVLLADWLLDDTL
jgi:hypothetical protein